MTRLVIIELEIRHEALAALFAMVALMHPLYMKLQELFVLACITEVFDVVVNRCVCSRQGFLANLALVQSYVTASSLGILPY